jgi:glycosyltransferase involved in cell wall biosynthesis
MRTLYLCYFGLREPLVQTQVLPYLREIGRSGADVSLLTFEPAMRRSWTREGLDQARDRLRADGIRWFALPYHKSPSMPATLYDMANGARLVVRLVRRHAIDTLHARSHVACIMGAMAKRLTGARLIFDIRGLMAEEYVDAGTWPEGGYLYHLAKAAERRLLKVSDGFVVLTERAREVLFPGAEDTDPRGRPIEVIPCCVDFRRFRSAGEGARDRLRAELGVTGRRVVVYVGALSGWYMTEEMADFLDEARRQDASTFALVLTQSPPEWVTGPLLRRGLSAGDYLVRTVSPETVPSYLRAADVALSFIKPCYSKLSSSPTKVAEYLAAGLPVVSSSGIGDMDAVLEGDRVGVLVRRFDREAYRQALQAVEGLRQEDGFADRCLASARDRFDLEQVGGVRYRRLYQRVREGRGLGAGQRDHVGAER